MSDTPPDPAKAKSEPSRSHGRKAIRPTLKPRALMDPEAELARAWQAQVITLMPELFPGVLGASLTGKALKDGIWQLSSVPLRQFGEGKHRNVDDTPAGGGAGMVLRADIMAKAIETARRAMPAAAPLLYLSPRGRPFTQAMAQSLASGPGVTLICGRFEGLDQRVIDHFRIKEVSLGDFVLTGGEIAAQALLDATVRLLPGVLGNAASAEEESFSTGLLEHPQYTRPAEWRGHPIPPVLTSGNHGAIAEWRRAQAEALTQARRPDLWEAYQAMQARTDEKDS
ncbi:tRNA (guanosine(37)-N1)-methyltransferase TrmD [Cognatishimia sp. F0-27]|uniref:tRNA (guanosine(37)-N1)-methyltransferase TrmD n=1 Tax=Cognatishimia sp. F0-27 TaxID=2816855 RepID=UPI001D0C408A|nr:tRNA (guanosine(37)-N1)-methyltransferase TrmD [Cognatishimia sp. F0-27]MCC1494279.1 tRNA (guanosine(37)-N1)-methyltransferase TrmD [Cognatishimia sp. F0-27]